MRWLRLLFLSTVGTTTVMFTACQREPFSIVPVEGVLRKAGKPMDNMKVEFYPERESGTIGPRAHGVTDTDGRFQLQTDAGENGAVVGKHRVVLTDVEYLERTAPIPKDHPIALKHKGKGPPVKRIDGEYEEYLRTPLRSEATPPSANVTIEVK